MNTGNQQYGVYPSVQGEYIYVPNIQAVHNYFVCPGNTVKFLDYNEPYMYIKTVALGTNIEEIKRFIIDERPFETPTAAGSSESNKEMEDLKTEMSNLRGQLNEITEMLKNANGQRNNQPRPRNDMKKDGARNEQS